MNIMNKLTIRHLKENKKRTLVTVFGVIISVAMITAVATLIFSFMDLLQRDAMNSEGKWHVRYENINEEQLRVIEEGSQAETVFLSKTNGYGMLEGSQNPSKPYLYVRSFNEIGFESYSITLTEGKLPESANEIVLTEATADNAGVIYSIGDQIQIDLGDRVQITETTEDIVNQTYSYYSDEEEGFSEEIINLEEYEFTVVGFIETPIWEPSWAPGYTALSFVDLEALTDEETFDASVFLTKVSGSIYDDSEELAAEINSSTPSFNNELLRYYGVTSNDGFALTMLSLSSIIIAIIMVGSVALIFNAFAISVSERSRHLGMLSSVGATKKQKMNSVFFEGLIIGLISIPLGLASGVGGIGITFYFMNSMLENAFNMSEGLRLIVTPLSIILAVAISFLTIFISTFIPALKASRITAIDAIRQTTDIKLSKRAVKTPKIVRAIFGIEAEFALKNLKRNKRRYQVTIFSLVISIILFLSVSFFTSTLTQSVEISQDASYYDIAGYSNATVEEIPDEVYEGIKAISEVTTVNQMNSMSMYSMVKEEHFTPYIKKVAEENPDMVQNGEFPYYLTIYSLRDEQLEIYAEEAGVSLESLNDVESPNGILLESSSYYDGSTEKYVQAKTIETEIGNSISFAKFDWDTNQADIMGEATISALTSEKPVGVNNYGGESLTFFVSEPLFEELVQNLEPESRYSEIYITSEDPIRTFEEMEEMNLEGIDLFNNYSRRQEEKQFIIIMSVFTYGFIFLITAISVANIFNTISTSISLRKREFGMLKSVGMTPESFNKMINFESLFYGIKSLAYGIPISIGIMYLIHRATMSSFTFSFEIPWLNLGIVIVAVFLIVSAAMLYSISKVKKENIIDALKQENI